MAIVRKVIGYITNKKKQIAGWDESVLQKIINNCDAGDSGMDKCADAGTINDSSKTCNIKNQVPETISGVLEKLPGDNPPSGWGQGKISSSSSSSEDTGSSTTANAKSAVYTDTATSEKSPENESHTDEWSYLGCYSDNLSARVLNGVEFADLGEGKVTSTACISYCKKAGFSMAGTEYAGECFCGTDLGASSKIAANKCNMKCDGDASQVCGGSLALSVYGKASETSSKKSTRHLSRHRFGRHINMMS